MMKTMSTPNTSSFSMYANFPLFQGVDPSLGASALEACPICELKEGDILLEPGQSGDDVYLLLSGRLCVHLGSLEDAPIICLEVGECVGEMSIIEEKHASAFVVAERDSRLLKISQKTLWHLINSSHAFARNMLYTLSQRLRHNNQLIIAGLKREQQFQHYAHIDPLTDLYNRRWLDEYLCRVVRRCQEKKEPFSVIMLDVDHFKKYNDDHGHLAGDRALIGLAKVIRRCIRVSDMPIRFGGEEFLVLLQGASQEIALEVAQRLCDAVRAESILDLEGKELQGITISLGVATANVGNDGEDVIQMADEALYKAKKMGRDRVAV